MNKIKVSHILVQYKHDCEDLLRRLDGGANFADLARKHSLCSSRTQGGNLGEVDTRRLDEDFLDALLSLKVGDISSPVRTRFGFHILRRES